MHDPKLQHPSAIIEDSLIETSMVFYAAWVDADMARDLLLYNREPEVGKESTNRKASPVVIGDYTLTMLKGNWHLSPQPIIFSEKDPDSMSGEDYEEMIDGQQRLKAVILASQTQPDIRVPFTLCFDAPNAAKWLLDMNKRRQPGDFLRMKGEINPGFLSKALKMLYSLQEQTPFKSIGLWRAVKLSPQEQDAFLAKHPDLRYGLSAAKSTKTLFSHHVGAVLFYLVHREFGVYRAEELFRALASGAELSTDDARRKVREFIAVKSKSQHKWDGFEQLALLITATNAWLLGQDGDYRALQTFNKLSKVYPRLVTAADMPTSVIVPGNDPALDARSLPQSS